jgi:hypothetical protein
MTLHPFQLYAPLTADERSHLESIGYEIRKQTQEEQGTQLQEQIVLLQSLCEKITQEVELPAQAIAGLGDLLFRVSGIIDRQDQIEIRRLLSRLTNFKIFYVNKNKIEG